MQSFHYVKNSNLEELECGALIIMWREIEKYAHTNEKATCG